jgi:hypothetical protein
MRQVFVGMLCALSLLGQQHTDVEQNSHGGQCNNIVAQGSVTLSCTGLTEAEAKMLLSLSTRILAEVKRANRIDPEALYHRLDQCISLASDARNRAFQATRGVSDLQKYSAMANLTFNGSPVVGGDVNVTTPISKAVEGTWQEVSPDRFRPVCDEAALDKDRAGTRDFPEFPFTYYALAYCLEKKGDLAWKSYAQTAVDIFEKTTAITGHQGSHDQMLGYLRQILGRK